MLSRLHDAKSSRSIVLGAGLLLGLALLVGCNDLESSETTNEGPDSGTSSDTNQRTADVSAPSADMATSCEPPPLASEVADGHETTVSVQTLEPPIIDGDLDEDIYGELPELVVTDSSGTSDNRTEVRTMWDDDFLYIAIDMADDSIETDESAWISSRDGVELMLDVEGDRGAVTSDDHHWIIDANGEILTELYTSTDEEPATELGQEVGAARTADGYTIELRVPVASLNLVPAEAVRMGLLVVTNDRDDAESTNFTWPSSAEWKVPDTWGEVYMAESSCEHSSDVGPMTDDTGSMTSDGGEPDPDPVPCADGGDFQTLDVAGPAIIGGGPDYANKVCRDDADVVVETLSELEDALAAANAGDVVFIDPDAEIDMGFDARLLVPAGVTLSGGRGCDCRAGALLFTDVVVKDDYDHEKMLLAATDSRITGLRIRGPRPVNDWIEASEQDHYLDGRGIDVTGADVEIDNNEIWGFAEAGVAGDVRTHVHHNNIHDMLREGLGYGVNGGDDVVIEYNYFNWVRHAIASGGRRSYEARYNHMGSHAISHVFDMHRDGGQTVLIHHNTFEPVGNDIKNKNVPGVAIRGVPSDVADIHHNWFYNPKLPCTSNEGESWADCAIHQRWVDEFRNVTFSDNHYGVADPEDCSIGAPRDGCPLP